MSGTRSRDLFERARRVMPGGVSSPVRAFGYVGGDPIFLEAGDGARVRDVDGREYIDFVLSWGPLVLGHRHPRVMDAVADTLRRGTHYGMPTPQEVALAEKITGLVPSMEVVRFVNSGTEATMSAVRLARAATGRDLLLKFDGAYHGHADGFLSGAGSGLATLGIPTSPGVPASVSELTLTVPFNDPEAVEEAFRRHGDRIAAVIVEPVMGNVGLIGPEPGFLELLRSETQERGALLIFDEVMTGFRVALGGAQARYGIRPDLTTLGKVIGAGFPVGAYGGSRKLMARIAPQGDVYQAGTLSGNPVAMAAGLAQLQVLEESDPYDEMERRADRLVKGLIDSARDRDVPATGRAIGSMWCVYFCEGPVRSFADTRGVDRQLFGRYYRACLEAGLLLPPSPFEACFLSTAHGKRELDLAVEGMASALANAAGRS